jgi:uncharacterized membrane protein
MTSQLIPFPAFQGSWLKKITGFLLLSFGFLLSPLSCWNDLFFNLPIAYGFGYLCRLLSPSFFLPGTIAGYWLSNLVGIVLMQVGTTQLLQKQSSKNNFKKAVWSGVLSSSVFTVILLVLIQFNILDLSSFMTGNFLVGLSSIFPDKSL